MRLTLKTKVKKKYGFLIRVRHMPHLQNHKFKKEIVLSTKVRHVPRLQTTSSTKFSFVNKNEVCASL
jgi:hypothetical protein